MGRDGEELQAFCFPSSTRGKKINNKQLWGEMTATKGFPLRALCPLGGKRLSERRRCDVLILQFYCSHDFGREIRFVRINVTMPRSPGTSRKSEFGSCSLSLPRLSLTSTPTP